MGSNQTDIRFLGDDFNRYYQRCVLFAKSYTYDSAQAECMAAEAMAVLWEKMAAGEQVEFVLPFLFSVIRNKALHYLRRESLKYQIHGSVGSDASREIQFRINTLEACDPHALYAEDVQTILHKSLDALGRQTRRVFMLSRFEGMSNRQIAQELGISEKSVEYHVTKALKQLRTDLKDSFSGDLTTLQYIRFLRVNVSAVHLPQLSPGFLFQQSAEKYYFSFRVSRFSGN